MVYFDLVLNEWDTAAVELWQSTAGKKYLCAVFNIEVLDGDRELTRRLEDGEAVPVTMRVMK